MKEEIIRVLRVLEYVGPRSKVEEVLERSIQGQKTFGTKGQECTIRAATIGLYPEVLEKAQPDQEEGHD